MVECAAGKYTKREEEMIKRYFYTDSLAAEWMNKHHGMRFSNEEGKEVVPCFYRNLERFYVHPESVGLLNINADTDVVHQPKGEVGVKIFLRNNMHFMCPEWESIN